MTHLSAVPGVLLVLLVATLVLPGHLEALGTDTGASTLPSGTGQRWLHLLATVLLLGIVSFRYGALRYLGEKDSGLQVRERANRNLVRIGWVATAVLVLTLVTRLQQRLAELADAGGGGWEYLPHLLFRTGWGGGWFIHLGATVLAFTGLVLIRRGGETGRGWGILTGAAILLPLILAFQGHAMASPLRQVAIPLLYLHVAGVGIWLGGLLVLILAGLPAVRRLKDAGGGLPPLARLVNGFSRVALVAVTLLVLTGVLTSLIQGDGLGATWASGWGRTLALKLGLVGAAFLMGFYNWRKVRPGLSSNPDPSQLRIPASVEAVLGLLVLLATAVLVALPLP